MNNLQCKDCCYCWKEDNDRYPVCHWINDGFNAPCEEEPYWNDEEDDWQQLVDDYKEEW